MAAPARKKPTVEKDSPRERTGVLNAINSPLGFYVLALLIAEVTIGLVLVKSDLEPREKFYGLLLAVGMFVVVVFVVTVLVWFKAENLTFDRDAHLRSRIPYGTETEKLQSGEVAVRKPEPVIDEEVKGHG